MASKKKKVPRRIRSPRVTLSKAWLDDLHRQWRRVKHGEHPKSLGQPTTLKEFGKVLAKHIGRPRAFAPNMLGRFMRGENTNRETLDAFCGWLEIPSPLLTAESIAEVEWFIVGQALLRESPEKFREFLSAARSQLLAQKEFRKLEQELGSNPDVS